MTSTVPVHSLPTTARAAADAALSVLPVTATLAVGLPGEDPSVTATSAAAVCLRLVEPAGQIAIMVDQELVDALHSSPLGELDLAKAVGPALDAAAGVVGSATGPAIELPMESALRGLAEHSETVFVPLAADGRTHAVVAVSLSAGQASATNVSIPTTRQPGTATAGLELLHGVEMDVTAELGRTRLTVRELLSLRDGTVVELDRAAGSPADVMVNGQLIARGEVVVIDENFGIRITEIVSSSDRTNGIG